MEYNKHKIVGKLTPTESNVYSNLNCTPPYDSFGVEHEYKRVHFYKHAIPLGLVFQKIRYVHRFPFQIQYVISFCLLIIFFVLPTGYISAQSSKELQAQRRAILETIEQTSLLLNETRTSARSSLNRLNLLTQQIQARKNAINLLNREVAAIDREITALNVELAKLESDLKTKREQYTRSVQSMQTRRSSQYKWLFVLSADNFAQLVRRMRYIREYADWQKRQAAQIMQKQEEIILKKSEIEQSRAEKTALLSAAQEESKQLSKEEAQLRTETQQLTNRRRELEAEINQKRRQADALNRQIEALIAKETRSGSAPSSSEDIKLSNDFASNRGRLPFPVSGRYTVVRPFGIYSPAGQRNVQLESNGIDIQVAAGTEARSVFNGVVSEVFSLPGQTQGNIMVRHGSYITFYANLSEVYVKKGQNVTTLQSLGKIATNSADNSTILEFRIYRETEKLNPELWLR